MAQAKRLAGEGIDLILVARSTEFAYADIGDEGDSPGDIFMFEHRIYNEAETEVVGTSASSCAAGITNLGRCETTLRLHGRGKILNDGIKFGGRDYVFAVTGGTGEFMGVSGEMHTFFLRRGGCCGIFIRIYKLTGADS